MAKTYRLKSLWPLLSFEVAAPPLRATLDAYGGGLVKYAIDQDGLWLFSPTQPLAVHESEALTGFHLADMMPKKIGGLDSYFYGMEEGSPLLPIPFTADQLAGFETRTAGLIAGCIERGIDTDEWIAGLESTNPDAAELAIFIRHGIFPQDSDTDTDMIQSAIVAAGALVADKEKPKFSMTKAAMVSEHKSQWPTIERNMADASKNGLAAAKSGVRGWDESVALGWAKANNKLENAASSLTQAMHSMGSLIGQKHKL